MATGEGLHPSEWLSSVPRPLQFSLGFLLLATGLAAVAVTLVWQCWLAWRAVAVVVPAWLTCVLILVGAASPARDKTLDVGANPWFRALAALTLASWLVLGFVLAWPRLGSP